MEFAVMSSDLSARQRALRSAPSARLSFGQIGDAVVLGLPGNGTHADVSVLCQAILRSGHHHASVRCA
jgi:hypothetical protein